MQFSDEELERYSRQIIVPHIGAIGQNKLRQARVLVVGAGGLGAPLLQLLASSGIGHVGVIDPDMVELSNLSRQTLFTTQDIGRRKVDVISERLRYFNPYISIKIWDRFADTDFLTELISSYDSVCDGTDNIKARLAISDACVKQQRTLVSGAVQGSMGQFIVLHPQRGGPCYRCLYPHLEETPSAGCSQLGVMSPAPTIIAGFMAMAVINECVEVQEEQSAEASLKMWNFLTGEQKSICVKRRFNCDIHSSM